MTVTLNLVRNLSKKNLLTETLAQPCMNVFLCFMSYALRYSSYFFVHLLIFFHLSVYM